MSVSVVIVNFRSASLILDALESLYRYPQRLLKEVIVVDNASGDDSEQLITQKFPQVKWWQMDYNAGFARANNAGIRMATGEAVLLLNPDTIIEDNAIETCAGRLLRSTHVAAGVQLLHEDRSPQISGNFFMKGGLNHLMAVPYSGSILRWAGLKMQVKSTNIPEAVNEVKVDWINGAFLMVKKSAIEKAGLLDEDFFLYSEEIEWCYRLGKIGTLCIYGDLHVVHLVGVSAGKAFNSTTSGYNQLTDKKGLQLLLSGWVRIRKQFGIGWFLMHFLFYWASIPFGYLCAIILGVLKPSTLSARMAVMNGFARNTIKATKYVGKILDNRPYFYKVL